MSIVAIVPVASLVAANLELEEAGFGPHNFSVPAYKIGVATHAALHAWDDAALLTALQAIPAATVDDGTAIVEGAPTDPVGRTQALIEVQGAKWGAQLHELPATGAVAKDSMWRWNGDILIVLQAFNRTTYPADPYTYPALLARVHEPGERRQWKQPGYAFDTYRLVNPFSGKADECINLGKILRTKIDYNTTNAVPGQFWDEIDEAGNVIVPPEPPAEEWPAWHVWDGNNASLYQVGAKVSHAGKRWIGNTPNNHWEPGVYGWTQQP